MELAELQGLEAAMRVALAELYSRASAGERSRDLADLAQHVRELVQLLDKGLGDIAADSHVEKLRAVAMEMATRLTAIEGGLAGARMQ